MEPSAACGEAPPLAAGSAARTPGVQSLRQGDIGRIDPVSLTFFAEDDVEDVLSAEFALSWRAGPFVWPDP